MRWVWALAPLLGGCFFLQIFEAATLSNVSEWYEIPRVKRPLEEIAQCTYDILARDGYKMPRFDPRGHMLETEWDVHLSSIFRQGFRQKVEVVFQPVSDRSYNVRFRSYREVNDDPKFPMMADRAVWMGATIDTKQGEQIPDPAIRLKQLLRYKIYGMSNE